jgi:hypothetical protein
MQIATSCFYRKTSKNSLAIGLVDRIKQQEKEVKLASGRAVGIRATNFFSLSRVNDCSASSLLNIES